MTDKVAQQKESLTEYIYFVWLLKSNIYPFRCKRSI